MKHIATVVAGHLLVFAAATNAVAATHHVPDDYHTISAAIQASVNGDVIQVAVGTFHENNLALGGKGITIQGTLSSEGDHETIIDAQQQQTVFMLNSGEGVATVIKDLHITGCGVSGIYCHDTSPIITNCKFTGITSWDSGAGIQCWGSGSVRITGCTITGNTAAGRGGGIFCSQNAAIITGCTITGNTTNTSSGGGIYCGFQTNPTISGCTISHNTAHESGGGIFAEQHSSPHISDCTISDNTAQGTEIYQGGGGIYFFSLSTPSVTNCHITDNTATHSSGGGIFLYFQSSPIITGSTITGNMAPHGKGGGIYCDLGSRPMISSSTIRGNTPHGIFKKHGSSRSGQLDTGHVILDDTTICDNGDETFQFQVSGLVMHAGENYIHTNCDAGASPGDMDGDGDVDMDDLSQLHVELGTCQHDVNHDGSTNVLDLLEVVAGWNTDCQ